MPTCPPCASDDGQAPMSRAMPSIQLDGPWLVVVNGELAVRLPGNGLYDAPLPGPIAACRLDDGGWVGESRIAGVGLAAAVCTVVQPPDADGVCWRTTYHWGGELALEVSVDWAAGADTLVVTETIHVDTDAGGISWRPFGDAPTTAWKKGGGENTGPMEPVHAVMIPGATQLDGERLVARLSHISYHNQWRQAWIGFQRVNMASADRGAGAASAPPLIGIFTGWASRWQRRGHVGLEVRETSPGMRHAVWFPLRRGRRCYGIVLTRWHVASPTRTPLHARKRDLADLPPAKRAIWDLDAALPTSASWDLAPEHPHPRLVSGPPPADFVWPDPVPLLAWAEKTHDDLETLGFEGLLIFHGRQAKARAYEFDVLAARGALSATEYRRVAGALLGLAYVFADPDYCDYGDFDPRREPADSGIAATMQLDMGDAPVPPNFASEYFSTVGLVAELFPCHPAAAEWRAWSIRQTLRFLDTWYEPDGTYHESLNYHTHGMSEMLAYFHPLRLHGGPDFFAHPRVLGSFAHFVALQTPALAARHGRAEYPPTGNSGHDGEPQLPRGELTVPAAVYRDSRPDLAAALMHLWHTSGRVRRDHEHAVLSEWMLPAALEIAPRPAPWASQHRLALGVVSKALTPAGDPLYALLRAGRGTHHMDFDQGSVFLIAGDRVLLGDHGYHSHDSDGTRLNGAATWLHSTLCYADDHRLSSGYAGLELAPAPARVHLDDTFDWVVHRIVNTNYRDLERLTYRDVIPAPTTVHVRHYLFVKPDYIVLWDTFESTENVDVDIDPANDLPRNALTPVPATCRLTPALPVAAVAPGLYRAGAANDLHLDIHLVEPVAPVIIESRPVGPLWTLAWRGGRGTPFLTVLAPGRSTTPLTLTWRHDLRQLRVQSATAFGGGVIDDLIHLPPPGDANTLPTVERQHPAHRGAPPPGLAPPAYQSGPTQP